MELVLIYIFYLVLTAILLIIFKKRLNEQFGIYLLVAAVVPIIGLLFAIAELFSRRKKEVGLKEHMEQLDADIFSTGVEDVESISMYEELKVIPIQEALVVNDHFTRRKVMIDVLKEDSLQYIESLQIAIQNEDTETSHYAVSAITEIKRKLSNALQELSAAHADKPDDVEIALAYAQVLKKYAASGYMDAATLRAALVQSIVIHTHILECTTQDKSYSFKEKMEAEISTGQYSEAEQTGYAYQAYEPNEEEPYLLQIELYVEMKAYSRLQQTLLSLKQSRAVLTNNGLDIVRYWSRGEIDDVS